MSDAPTMTEDEKNRRIAAQLALLDRRKDAVVDVVSVPCGECGVWTRFVRMFRCYQCGLWLCDACGATHWPDAAKNRQEYQR